MAARHVAVFDIDGVLADVSQRVAYLQGKPKNWKAFFASAVDDAPLTEGFDLLHRYAVDHDIVFVTGRPESCRSDTVAWLERQGVTVTELHMRRPRDYRRSAVAKAELLAALAATGRTITVVVDDDPTVVTAYREAGHNVLHATWAQELEELAQAQQVEGRV